MSTRTLPGRFYTCPPGCDHLHEHDNDAVPLDLVAAEWADRWNDRIDQNGDPRPATETPGGTR